MLNPFSKNDRDEIEKVNKSFSDVQINDYIEIDDRFDDGEVASIEIGQVCSIEPATFTRPRKYIKVKMMTVSGTFIIAVYGHQYYTIEIKTDVYMEGAEGQQNGFALGYTWGKLDKLGVKQALERRTKLIEKRKKECLEIEKILDEVKQRENANNSISDQEIKDLLSKARI